MLYGYGLSNSKLGRSIILSNIQVPGDEQDSEVEYVFHKTKHEKLWYEDLLGKERLFKKRKTRKVGKAKQAKGKARSSKHSNA